MGIKEILKRELELLDKLGEDKKESLFGMMYSERQYPSSKYSTDVLKEILSYKCEVLKMLTMIEVKEVK
jgi:hypothetical protein